MLRSVALIGLPASGKTSVGRILASLTGLPFVDLDELVEAEAGRDIPAIFRDEGEAGFRRRERDALARAANLGAAVVATGGGCVESPENRAVLGERFFVVWLDASPETAAARAAASAGGGARARPLLGGDAGRSMKALYARRQPWYASCADLALAADGPGPRELAEAIARALDGADAREPRP